MADALAETGAAMTTYAASGSAADAAAARASVVRTQEVVERHLAHEENELEPELQPHLETPEWKAVEKKLRQAPPGVAGPLLRLAHRRDERAAPRLPAARWCRRRSSPCCPSSSAAATTGRSPRLEADDSRPAGAATRCSSQRRSGAVGRSRTKQQAAGQLVPRRGSAAGAALLDQLAHRARRTPGGCRPSPARAKASPSSSAVSLRLVVEVPDHLEVVADEADREEDDGASPPAPPAPGGGRSRRAPATAPTAGRCGSARPGRTAGRARRRRPPAAAAARSSAS